MPSKIKKRSRITTKRSKQKDVRLSKSEVLALLEKLRGTFRYTADGEDAQEYVNRLRSED